MTMAAFQPERMAAWCIVPYDSRGRTPQERAQMVASLGLAGEVWDWRDQHIEQFPAELDALAGSGLTLYGLWAPCNLPADYAGLGDINPSVRQFVQELAARGQTPDLWVCPEFGEPGPFEPLPAEQQAAREAAFAAHLAPLAALAGKHGMRLALYNHLGWFGEPENQIAVIKAMAARGIDNVGIVYQQHHGHAHLDRWPELFATMAPYLYALGLNGMVEGHHWGGRKIHPYGRGPRDVELAQVVAESDWAGLVTVLCHTMDDAEERLSDNLDGVVWVAGQLRGEDLVIPPTRVPEPVWPH